MLRKAEFFNMFSQNARYGSRDSWAAGVLRRRREELVVRGRIGIKPRTEMADLRAGMDGIGGGPAPFAKADRSRFLRALDEALVRMG